MRDAPLLAAGLTAAALAVLGWPALWQPGTQVLGGGQGDFPSIAWGLWQVAASLPALPTRFPDLYYPQGATLLVADLPGAILLSPVTALLGPIAAFNVLQAAHPILAAAAGALLCEERWGAVVCGVSLGLSQVLLSSLHNGNPDVTPIFWVPLAALASSRIGRGWRWAVLAGLAVGLSAWFNPYVGAMAGIAALVMAPWRSPWSLLAGSIALAVAGLYAAAVQGTLDASAAMIAKPALDVTRPSPGAADLAGWLWPAGRTQPDGWSVHAWFPGATVLVLAAAGWRAGGRWWLLVAAGTLLSLGPILQLQPGVAAGTAGTLIALPGRWVQQLPGFSSLHIQYRLAALAVVGLGGLAAAGTARLPARWRWVAAAAVVAELSLWGAPLVQAGPAPPDTACRLLAPLPPGAVLDLPGEREERRMLAQTCHGRPIAEGLNQPYPGVVRQRLGELSALSSLGFRYIVIHEDVAPQTPPGERLRARTLLAEAQAAGMVAASAEGVSVIDLGAP